MRKVRDFLLSVAAGVVALSTFYSSLFPRWLILLALPAAMAFAVTRSRSVTEKMRPLFVAGALIGAIAFLYILGALLYTGFAGLCPRSVCN